MKVDVALLPRDIEPGQISGRAVIVFDVLRATTSITAALAAGVSEITIFRNVAAVRNEAARCADAKPVLCGEEKCFKPDGFDLGNSPGDFDGTLSGKNLFMSTTNGTRALLAAQNAKLLLVGALVNASAAAKAARDSGLDVTLLCSGTDGRMALEDVIGAGAVIDTMTRQGGVELESDTARMAQMSFDAAKNDLRGALSLGAGGRNVINAGLAADVEFAACLDRFPNVVGKVEGQIIHPLTNV